MRRDALRKPDDIKGNKVGLFKFARASAFFVIVLAFCGVLIYSKPASATMGTVSIGDGATQLDGTYLNAQDLASQLATANVTVQADSSVTIVDPSDLSSSADGTPKYDLTLDSPVCNISSNLNLAAVGYLHLDCGTINLNAQITSGGSLIASSRIVSTASRVNVLSNSADVQQAIDASSATATPVISVAAGKYMDNLVINHTLALSGNDGTAPTGAGPSAPTINGLQPGGNVITVVANGVKVDGLSLNGLVNGGTSTASNDGIVADHVDGLTVAHNTFEWFSGLSIAAPGSTTVVTVANETIIDPATVTIGNGTQQPNGTYLNCQKIADNLVFTSITLQATGSITVADPCDLSSSTMGTPQYNLSLITPLLNINNNLNMAAAGSLLLTDTTINLNGKFTSGGNLLHTSRIISTATQVNVISNLADIQQAIGVTSVTAYPTVTVGPGQYTETIVINQPMTLSGVDGTNPTGADPSAPTIDGTEYGDPVIDVVQNNVEIDGFHLNGTVSGSPYQASSGISFANDETVTAAHNTFDESSFSGPGINTANAFAVTLNANDFVLPAPSLNSGASPTHSAPFLDWSTSGGVAAYDIYRNGAQIGSTTSDFYIDNTAPQGSNAYYVVADSGITPVGNNTTVSPASNTATVVYDTAVPTITYSISPVPNGNNWNNTAVTVTFNCSDAAVGIASCTGPTPVIQEGTGFAIIGTAVNNAGDSAQVVALVNIDETPPTLGTPVWGQNPVTTSGSTTLTVPATDGRSGVAGGEYYLGTNDPGVGNGTPMAFDGTNLSASFGSLAAGSYAVNVRSQDNAGNWSPVTTTTLVVNNPIPAAPANLNAATPTDIAPALSWDPSANAFSYNIYRDNALVGTSTTNSFTDSSATPGTYSYYVTAVDTSGESTGSTPINVTYDTAAPTITYTLSQTPNANGWNNANVTVTFNCSDAVVGIATCSSPANVLNDGYGQKFTGTAVNNAGTTASVTATVNLDKTAPTLGTPSWSANPANTTQTSTLWVPPTDNLSGVAGGEYYLGSTDPGVGNGIPMEWDTQNLSVTFGPLATGTYVVNVRAQDNAGNWSGVTTTSLVVNNPTPAAPSGFTAASPTNSAPALSWNPSQYATSYNIYRDGSKIGTSPTNSYTDSSATPGTYSYTVTAVDANGEGSPNNPITVIYDTTAPNITYTTSPAANSAGWFNTPVTVSFVCTGTSGDPVTACSSPAQITTSGANQSVTANATDAAGNSASDTFTFKVDFTSPALGTPAWSVNPATTGQSSTLAVGVSDAYAPVTAGEYYIGATDPGVGSATSMTLASGKLSAGISESTPGTYAVNVRALNAAGTWSPVTTTSLVVNAPISAAPTHLVATSPTNQPPALSWAASSGAASYNVYRNGSKVGSSGTANYTDNSAPSGSNSYYVTAVNSGGESGPSNTISVLVDTTAPTITYTLSQAANSAGWQNSPVTVTFACSDSIVTITSCTSPVTISTDGANQTVTGTAVDSVGNTASVTATINLDQSLPLVATPVWSANPITAGLSATVTAAASDSLSGVTAGEYFVGTTDPGLGAGTPMTLNGGNLSATLGSSLGAGTYQVNIRALDAAGNWSAVSTTSLVVNPVAVLPAITSAATATTTVGAPFSFTVTTTGSPTAAVTESGTLPTAITFTANGNGTATIAGTAAAGKNGTYPIVLTATNSAGHVTQNFTLTVTASTAAPKITNASSVTVAYGVAMTAFAITTTGSPAPALTATALPSGLKFTDNGNGTASITGTPTKNVSGPYAATITAKNSIGTVTQAFTVYVTKAPVFSQVGSSKLTAILGSAFSVTVSANGYPVPVMTESGTLPTGLKFKDNGNGTATISGTPAAGTTGNYTFKVTGANSFGNTSETFILMVVQAPAITSASSASAKVGTAFKFQVTSTGFPAPDYFILGSLPKGLTYNVETGVISGTPAAGTSGKYSVTIFAYNRAGITAQKFTLTVQ